MIPRDRTVPLLALAGYQEGQALGDLLDRLEQVRVEDYDAKAGYRGFRDPWAMPAGPRSTPSVAQPLADVVKRGLGLFGWPEEEGELEVAEVCPDLLCLVAWETLVAPARPVRPHTATEQALPGIAN